MTEDQIRKIITDPDAAQEAVWDYELWDGTEAEFKRHVFNWKTWWPERQRNEEILGAYELGEIYDGTGYGVEGPYGGIY